MVTCSLDAGIFTDTSMDSMNRKSQLRRETKTIKLLVQYVAGVDARRSLCAVEASHISSMLSIALLGHLTFWLIEILQGLVDVRCSVPAYTPKDQYILARPSVSSLNPILTMLGASKIPRPSKTHLGSLTRLDIKVQSSGLIMSFTLTLPKSAIVLHSEQSAGHEGSGNSAAVTSDDNEVMIGVSGGVGGFDIGASLASDLDLRFRKVAGVLLSN